MSGMEWIAALAAATFVTVGVGVARGAARPPSWVIPATLSAAFLAYSAVPVVAQGPLGFWPQHTSDPWGLQIWIDLLLAAGVAWLLLVPALRRVGMRPLPWFALVAATGSIGILAVLARVLYLQQRAAA